MTMTRREFSLASLAVAASAPAAKYRIVDAQIHVWINDPRYPWAVDSNDRPRENRTPAMALELMKANGVERTVIAQFIGYKWDNRYCLDSIRKYAPYFRGVCRVNPTDPAAPDQLSHLTGQGFHGVRISPSADASGDWINGPLMPPLWKRAESLKIPMQVYAPITRMPDLVHLIEQCPDLTVVIDHMADCPIDRPHELEKLIALQRYPRVLVKISHAWSISRQSYPWLDAQEYVKRLHAVYGPRRLMWASDWPVDLGWTTYDKTLSVVRDEMKFLNAEDKVWILGRTAQKVWPFS
ncbi:MAG TPA: amidohydrolase family protein [Terracidiphilus sp.]|nr:amidohydrolase family protein [Terracidiphilus sp.]